MLDKVVCLCRNYLLEVKSTDDDQQQLTTNYQRQLTTVIRYPAMTSAAEYTIIHPNHARPYRLKLLIRHASHASHSCWTCTEEMQCTVGMLALPSFTSSTSGMEWMLYTTIARDLVSPNKKSSKRDRHDKLGVRTQRDSEKSGA